MDVSNVGWWVPVLTVAVPLLLLVALWVLSRLESWLFSPDDRAKKVAALLEQVETPDQVEQEVSRLLAEVTDKRRASANGRADQPSGSRLRDGRRAAAERGARALRLRRPVARSWTSDADGGSR